MTKQDYLKLLVESIHSTTVATIGADGHPQTRVIDMMLYDEQGVYFLTAKGKALLCCNRRGGMTMSKIMEIIARETKAFIIYRMKFKDNLAKKWEEAFKALPEDKLELVKEIVANNTFKDVDLSKYDQDIRDVLQFYLITRDTAKDMAGD